MAAVGSPAWVARTHGTLRARDQLTFALAAVAREVGALPAAVRRGTGRVLDADQSPPDSPLARAMEVVAEAALPAPLLAHSVRTWIWGRMLAEIDGIGYDEELLYVAALLHDLALAPGRRPGPDAGCFAVHVAREARALVIGAGAEGDVGTRVADAIAAHFNVRVPVSWGAEAHLLHGGAHLDVVGRRLREIAPETVVRVLQREPRTGFTECFVEAMRTEAELRPRSRAGVLWRLGMARTIRRTTFPAGVGVIG